MFFKSKLVPFCDPSFIAFIGGIFSLRHLRSVVVLTLATVALGSCGGGESGAPSLLPAVVTPAPSASPAPTPTPTTAVAPAGTVQSPTLAGAANLLAGFDVLQGLKPAWGTGAIPGIYSESEGAFRFTCGGAGKLAYDDPVVYPGQPGRSHLHQPWGNADFSAATTPASLAQSTKSDCNDTPYSANRSLYWMPALVNDQGEAIHPDLVSVYYKRYRSSSPQCDPNSNVFMGHCVGLPNQIRFVFGWDSNNPTAEVKGASWYCSEGTKKHYSNLDDVFNSGCGVGADLIANTIAPNCWDGKHLDASDHRSHMAWGSYGSWSYYKCPATHPYLIPQEENKAAFKVTADMIGTRNDGTHYSRIRLASDAMLPGAKPGQTLHADYIEAWVSEVKDMWMANCIEKGLSCSGGDLGNGLQLIGASQPSYGWVNPNPRESVPANPH